MNGANASTAISAAWHDPRLECLTVKPTQPIPGLATDLVQGFSQTPRMLPPKYFYDSHGSELFEQICDTPEYYPSRAESALLAAHATMILETVRPRHLIEFGSGNSRKTRHLLHAAESLDLPLDYWPFDVCLDMLERSGETLCSEFPQLRVHALVGDYLGGLANLPQPEGRRLFAFLGGTIGNFSEQESIRFLSDLRAQMRPTDYLLLGADRIKDRAILEAAYNDTAGVTAAFNLNLLRVINRELKADFRLSDFYHRALYNQMASRIEIYLVAKRSQHVQIETLDKDYFFQQEDVILTEISRKFSYRELTTLLARTGFTTVHHCEGGEQLFSLILARAT